jgi:DNA-binding CsgD family transcriptional regulator/PAS domain-containing protein
MFARSDTSGEISILLTNSDSLMKPHFFNQALQIWDKVVFGDQLKEVQFELEVHKKILNIFQAGDYYYYIFNLKEAKFDLMSDEVKKVLGYNPEDLDLQTFLNIIHPDDQSWFLSIENKVTEFFNKLTVEQVPNYKVRYDYRLRKSNGHYLRVLQQVITIQYSESGGVFRTFGVHTDISHLKMEGKPVLSFIGLNGEPSYVEVDIRNEFLTPCASITDRERQILFLLTEGRKTKEIAIELSISVETVSTHRKNLIRKTNAKNSSDMVVKAIKNGWI